MNTRHNSRTSKSSICLNSLRSKFNYILFNFIAEFCTGPIHLKGQVAQIIFGSIFKYSERFCKQFQVETSKKHDKLFQNKIYVTAYTTLLAPEDTPMAVCMKKTDKIFDHLKTLFSAAKNSKPFSDYESLLRVRAKLGVEV